MKLCSLNYRNLSVLLYFILSHISRCQSTPIRSMQFTLTKTPLSPESLQSNLTHDHASPFRLPEVSLPETLHPVFFTSRPFSLNSTDPAIINPAAIRATTPRTSEDSEVRQATPDDLIVSTIAEFQALPYSSHEAFIAALVSKITDTHSEIIRERTSTSRAIGSLRRQHAVYRLNQCRTESLFTRRDEGQNTALMDVAQTQLWLNQLSNARRQSTVDPDSVAEIQSYFDKTSGAEVSYETDDSSVYSDDEQEYETGTSTFDCLSLSKTRLILFAQIKAEARPHPGKLGPAAVRFGLEMALASTPSR